MPFGSGLENGVMEHKNPSVPLQRDGSNDYVTKNWIDELSTLNQIEVDGSKRRRQEARDKSISCSYLGHLFPKVSEITREEKFNSIGAGEREKLVKNAKRYFLRRLGFSAAISAGLAAAIPLSLWIESIMLRYLFFTDTLFGKDPSVAGLIMLVSFLIIPLVGGWVWLEHLERSLIKYYRILRG